MSNAKNRVNNVRGEGYGLIEWPITMTMLELVQKVAEGMVKQ